jgi:hypothetical protein
VDTARVMELYAPTVPRGGGYVGSGYRVSQGMVLTAAHVVSSLPLWRSDEPVPEDGDAQGVCWARSLGEAAWLPTVVVWRDEDKDLAVLRLAPGSPSMPAGSQPLRLGRVDGLEPVAVTGVGFPWAQERLDRVRDSEQLFGFIAPATTMKSGLYAVTLLTAPPTDRGGGSPWAGMSGAALFAGPFLVGVVVVDAARFGADRMMAAPVAPLFADAELARLFGVGAVGVLRVGPQFRLAVTAETSIALTPPYRASTGRLGRAPTRLLLPAYGVVPFVGRDSDLNIVERWCLTGAASALRVIVGGGGGGPPKDAAGRRGVRTDGKPGLAGWVRQPQGSRRGGATGV